MNPSENKENTDLRDRLAEKGLALLLEQRYQTIKISDILALIDVPANQFYSLFRSKEAFFLCSLEQQMNRSYALLLKKKLAGAKNNTLLSEYRIILIQAQTPCMVEAITKLLQRCTEEQYAEFWKFTEAHAGRLLTVFDRKPTERSKKIFLYTLALVYSDVAQRLQNAPLKTLWGRGVEVDIMIREIKQLPKKT